MGVQISRLIEPVEIKLEDLLGRRIAIDSFNILFQFLSSIRQYDGTPLMDSHGRITSHLSGLFYRTSKFMEIGIKPIFVFDGEAPLLKQETQKERREQRQKAKEQMEIARQEGKWEEARKYAQQSASLTDEMIKESKDLIKAMGLPVVQAPSEGEAEAAYLVKKGEAWATGSQDWDSLLFGSERLIQNLSISGRKKRGNTYVQINPQLIELKKILDQLKINNDQLILLGILIGTDFNPGIKGIGPIKGLTIVKKCKTPEDLEKTVDWSFSTPARKIFEIFKNPAVADVKIDFNLPDSEKIKKILVDEHDFSEERVQKVLNKIIGLKRESSLDKWVK
ncbi:MAG: flap endonuclease-1 [Candidatus Aenigmarchaeota archaeon]|nr:flap endonuclease-1 [Candidatus Aenigmarchaeota archaeon]